MEKSEIFRRSLKILENMDVVDFKKVQSGLGLVETCCTIVEESYHRLGKAASGKEKRETAIMLLSPVILKLKEKNVIDDDIEFILTQFVSRESVEDIVDELVESWKDNLETVHYRCLKLISLFFVKKRNSTRLSKVSDN